MNPLVKYIRLDGDAFYRDARLVAIDYHRVQGRTSLNVPKTDELLKSSRDSYRPIDERTHGEIFEHLPQLHVAHESVRN